MLKCIKCNKEFEFNSHLEIHIEGNIMLKLKLNFNFNIIYYNIQRKNDF